MFRGNHQAKVDEKGRLKIPSAFKALLDADSITQYFITSADGKSAEIYPLPEWEKIEQKLAEIPSFNPAKKKLLNYVNYYGQTTEIDAQGRVLLPQILREKTNTLGDVLVFGMQTYLKVTNREAFVANMELNPMTEEDERELENFKL